jgi:hypothetical protein
VVVVNLRHDDCEVFVDRKTKWGNPFRMEEDSPAERARVVEAYRGRLWKRVQSGEVALTELAGLRGMRLGCWCAPKQCHADVLLRAADWAHEQLQP